MQVAENLAGFQNNVRSNNIVVREYKAVSKGAVHVGLCCKMKNSVDLRSLNYGQSSAGEKRSNSTHAYTSPGVVISPCMNLNLERRTADRFFSDEQ